MARPIAFYGRISPRILCDFREPYRELRKSRIGGRFHTSGIIAQCSEWGRSPVSIPAPGHGACYGEGPPDVVARGAVIFGETLAARAAASLAKLIWRLPRFRKWDFRHAID